MKKLIAVVLVLMMALAAIPALGEELAGSTWYMVEEGITGAVLDLKEDGTFVFKTPDGEMDGTWTAVENGIEMTIDGETLSLSLEDGRLVDAEDGIILQKEPGEISYEDFMAMMAMMEADLAGDGEESTEEAAAETAVLSFEQFKAAENDSEVLVETYVQAIQKYNEEYGNTTIYAQSEDGAYFIYRLACTKEDAEKLVPGTKICVKGYKSEWGGEVEIIDATVEVIDGDSFIAEVEDVTAKVGTDELINCMNEYVVFKGMKVVGEISKKDDEKDPDIYFTAATADGAEVAFCVESTLRGTDTDAYKAAAELKDGDVVDIEAFLYWYNGANPHVVNVAAAE